MTTAKSRLVDVGPCATTLTHIHDYTMSARGRSTSPHPLHDADVDMENGATDKPNAKVVIVTNLTRNVVESHLQTIFGFYGEIAKIDLPIYQKCESHSSLSV